MIVNQANLHGLTVGYSTAFNKSFDTTQSNYQKVATVVPSTTGEQDYQVAWSDAGHDESGLVREKYRLLLLMTTSSRTKSLR